MGSAEGYNGDGNEPYGVGFNNDNSDTNPFLFEGYETGFMKKNRENEKNWSLLDESFIPPPPPVEEIDYKPRLSFEEQNKIQQQRAMEVGIIESVGDLDKLVKSQIKVDYPWFNDDFGGEFVFEDVVEALTIYKSIYGTFKDMNLDEFIVPDTLNPSNSDLDFAN